MSARALTPPLRGAERALAAVRDRGIRIRQTTSRWLAAQRRLAVAADDSYDTSVGAARTVARGD